MKRRLAQDVDEYIARHSGAARQRLERLRRTIRGVVPDAGEKISYGIPAVTAADGRVVLYFAAFEKHVSVYPAPRGNPEFADALAPYAGGKGTLRVPHDQPLPLDLVARIARFHLDRIQARKPPRAAAKQAARKAAGESSKSQEKAVSAAGKKRAARPARKRGAGAARR